MPTGHSRAAASSASDPPPQSRSNVQRGHVVLPSEEDFERASAFYRGRWDPEKGALAGDGPGWGHEQAAVAAAASGSSVAGASEEPLLSDNVPMLWPPDVEDVPLPKTFKRMRAEYSDKSVSDPLELHM